MSTFHTLLAFIFFSLAVVCSHNLAPSPSPSPSRDQADEAITSGINYLYFNYDEIHVREIETRQDPILKNKYNQYGVLYTTAVNALIQSSKLLNFGDYQKIPTLASTAMEKIQDCDKIFTPPGTETKFKGLNEKAIDVCLNVLNVVNGLVQ